MKQDYDVKITSTTDSEKIHIWILDKYMNIVSEKLSNMISQNTLGSILFCIDNRS